MVRHGYAESHATAAISMWPEAFIICAHWHALQLRNTFLLSGVPAPLIELYFSISAPPVVPYEVLMCSR